MVKGVAVESDDLAGDAGVAAEAPLPQLVADDRDRRRSGPIFRRVERAPEGSLDAEQREIGRSDDLALQPLGPARVGQAPLALGEERGPGEDLLPIAQDLILRVRPDHFLEDARRIAIGHEQVHEHQLAGIAKRQRADQHRVDEREDREVRADAECQREHRGCREAGAAPQRAQAVAQIAPEILQPAQPLLVAPGLRGRVAGAELQARPAARLVERDSRLRVFLGQQLQVFRQLLAQPVVVLASGQGGPQPFRKSPDGVHERSSALIAMNRSIRAVV